ncbi:MAG: polysaccharide biosynthesis/export family protein [Bryobacteraceae bacterium]|jgi:protein involved in polysaccharide export with SLBB domain
MRLPAITLLGFLLGAAVSRGQQQQTMPDCSAPENIDDPRCDAASRSLGQSNRQDVSAPRIPVIRDQSAAPFQTETLDRRRPADQPAPAPRRPLAPEEPTEFQKFVEQSIGHVLPIFGQSLFQDVPSTFAPADRVPVTPDYALGPGDRLMIRAWGQIDLSVSPVVDRSGAIYVPQVGELNVAGLKFGQIHDYLKTAIGRVFHNFDLSVNMGQLRSIQVLVVGHARRPGAYTISALSTLVNAVFASGGPDSRGSMRSIRLTRLDKVVTEFDLYDLLLDGDKSKDVHLLSGDVIYIPPVGPQVAVTGSVNTPAIYELKPGSTLAHALELAGGLTPVAARREATIERIDDSSRRVMQVPLDSATRLQNGDLISVLAIVPRFENAVTLRGNVADPIRMPWRPGMRIRDLIPDRLALLTRDYWRTRNRLAPPDRQPEDNVMLASSDGLAATDGTARGQPRPIFEARRTDVPAAAMPSEPRTGSKTNAPGSIGAANAGAANGTARNRVERNPLEVNWSYAVIERRDPKDLRTSLIPFRLDKAVLEGDESENLPLQPGDVVTIFSTADVRVPQSMQTRYVRLEGEFVSPGVYSVEPGENLHHLVARAGGLTPQAYLFGSEFLRESSRFEQQQRLGDFANSFEREAASSAANLRGSVLSPEEAAAATSQVAEQRELVQKLREVRATGRIVLDLDPRLPGPEALPDLVLEDGDVFTVPSRPSFVNVVGSVYNGLSFLYEPDKRLGDYLRESGGATRTGDARHAFLIRADGSVVSKAWWNGPLAQRFEGLRLNPGDTIVVPEQINKTTVLKGLKDWSQVFAQFGLGAAAISILK